MHIEGTKKTASSAVTSRAISTWTHGPQAGERPFPANFPEVKAGSRTTVRIAGENVLSCRLRP